MGLTVPPPGVCREEDRVRDVVMFPGSRCVRDGPTSWLLTANYQTICCLTLGERGPVWPTHVRAAFRSGTMNTMPPAGSMGHWGVDSLGFFPRECPMPNRVSLSHVSEADR